MTSCAACKLMRHKCTYDCPFAPYFPPDQPQKFANVHKIFGTRKVAMLLNELPPNRRQNLANSLALEAEYRLRYPEYGTLAVISILQQQLRQAQVEIFNLKKELSAMLPKHHAIMNPTSGATPGPGHFGHAIMNPTDGATPGHFGSQAHLHQMIQAQHMAAQMEQQELMRQLLQQQQQEMGAGQGAGFDPMGSQEGGGAAGPSSQ